MDHPPAADLIAYGYGRLGEPAADRIAAHLAVCPSCREMMEQLPDGGDHLLRVLRSLPPDRVPDRPDPTDDPVPGPLRDHPRYEVVGVLGRGGMGIVYRARHRLMGRDVALKVIRDRLASRPTAVERFRREIEAVYPCHGGRLFRHCESPLFPGVSAIPHVRSWGRISIGCCSCRSVSPSLTRKTLEICVFTPRFSGQKYTVTGIIEAVAGLGHPNVVQVYDAEQADDLLFLVMEFVEGADLARLVRERGPLPPAEACGYAVQAARGLQHAHERGLVHRDVKPANLIVTPDGVVKVLDFGLAALLDRDELPPEAENGAETPDASSLTALGRGLGTADYVAPEQAVDARLADIRSDIYSLGASLYHLLAGRPPFAEGDASRRLLGHVVECPRPLGEFRRDVPAGLVRVLGRMLAKNPAGRPETPADVATALAPFASPAWPHRRRFLAGLAATGVLAAAGVGWLLWQNRPAKAREVRRLDPHPGPIQAVALSPDEQTVLTGCDDHRLRMFDINTGELIRAVYAHNDWVVCVAFLPDGRHALSGSTDGTLRLWELETGKLIRRFENHEATVLCVAVTPDGRRAVTGTDNRLARVWDVGTGELLHRLEGHLGPVQCVGVSPDGKLGFSGGNDRTVRVWDINAGRELAKLEGHEHRVADFLPLGEGRLMSGCLDKTTRLWGLGNGQQLAVQEYPLRIARVLHWQGRKWAVGLDEDGVCRVYDAGTGTEWCRLVGHRATVWGFVATQDGRQAVTVDRSGVAIVWELPAAG